MIAGGMELRRRTELTYGGVRRNSGAARGMVEGGGLGERPGLTAELLRRIAGVEV